MPYILNPKEKLLLACYNAGMQTIINAGYKVPKIKETQNYIHKIEQFLNLENPKERINLKGVNYVKLIFENALMWNLNPYLVYGIAWAESDFDTNCITDNRCGGARGIMQIIREVWDDMKKITKGMPNYEDGWHIPEYNILVCCIYLRWLNINYIYKWEKEEKIKLEVNA